MALGALWCLGGCTSDTDSAAEVRASTPGAVRPAWTPLDRLCATASRVVVADVYPSVPDAGATELKLLVLDSLKGVESLEDRDSLKDRNSLEDRTTESLRVHHPASDIRATKAKSGPFPQPADLDQLTGQTMIAFLVPGADGRLRLVASGDRSSPHRALIPADATAIADVRSTVAAHRRALETELPMTTVDSVVDAFVAGMVHSRSGHDVACEQLRRLGRRAIPALVRHLDDDRPVPTLRPEARVRDSLLGVLAALDGHDFATGDDPTRRDRAIEAWRVRARYLLQAPR